MMLTFLAEQKALLAEYGNVIASYYAELLTIDSFRIHTAGGGDHQQGGPRTPSTLDEVYSRTN